MKKRKTTDVEILQKQIKELEAKAAELTAGWQRTQADFINFKRQVEQDRNRVIKLANYDLILETLPILDNFILAAKHTPAELEKNNWALGIKQIEKQLENALFNQGLIRIESVGRDFDPKLHEAVEETESERPPGEIVEEVSAGYLLGDCVLRPAKVKISAGLKNS